MCAKRHMTSCFGPALLSARSVPDHMMMGRCQPKAEREICQMKVRPSATCFAQILEPSMAGSRKEEDGWDLNSIHHPIVESQGGKWGKGVANGGKSGKIPTLNLSLLAKMKSFNVYMRYFFSSEVFPIRMLEMLQHFFVNYMRSQKAQNVYFFKLSFSSGMSATRSQASA